jgi:cobalt/nickel transport system ATP-binding protein
MTQGTPAIRVEGLSYSYAGGLTALDRLRFEIAPEESVGVVGPNGAGKSTLFFCLAGVLKVPPGAICIGGLDPGIASERRNLPAKVGIVFQDSEDQLFNSTLFEDVAFGPLNLGLSREEVKARVAEALEQVGLVGLEERVPFHLSGGEQRRAALAGVLAMRPQIVLLDEPSAFLDPRARRGLVRLVNKERVTKLIASHDLEFILATCDRAMLLDRGVLVADGPVRQVFADKALMEKHGLEVPHSLTYHSRGDQHHVC